MSDSSSDEDAPLIRASINPPLSRHSVWNCVRPVSRTFGVLLLLYLSLVRNDIGNPPLQRAIDSPPPARRAVIAEINHSLPAIRAEPLRSCTRCTDPDEELFKSAGHIQNQSPADAEAERRALAASNAASAISSRKQHGQIPVGQRMRVKWADNERHLGTVYDHQMQLDPISNREIMHTCITYDADPAGFRPCHDLSIVEFEMVRGGIFEVSPPPPGGQRLATTLRSCCHEGGSWDLKCGVGREHTWDDGLRACNLAVCPRCGTIKLSGGLVDRNCCNRGGSWFSHCGPLEVGWAFSWQEGFRVCGLLSGSRDAKSNGTRHVHKTSGSRKGT